jgi:hypothetical protein
LCLKCKRFSVVKLLFYTYDSLISYSLKGKMKNHRLLISIGASIASLLSGLLPAAADQTYNGASVYRDTDTIYKVGLTPNSDVAITYNRSITNKTVYSDACGYLKLSFDQPSYPSGTNVTIAGYGLSGFSPTLIPEAQKPKYKCTNGVAVFTNFTPPDGGSFYFSHLGSAGSNTDSSTFFTKNTIATGGKNKPVIVTEMGSKKKTIKANSCGFIAVKALPHAPFASFTPNTEGSIKIGDTSQYFSMLPVNPNPPICLNNQAFVSSTAPTTYNGASLYRTTKAIYHVGLTIAAIDKVELTGLESKDVSYYKGDSSMAGYVARAACGLFYVDFGKKKISTLKVGANNYTVSSLESAVTPVDCSSGSLAALTPNTLYRNQANPLVTGAASQFFYRVSDITQKKLTVQYPAVVTRNLPVNACGFAEIKSLNTANGFDPTDKVKINGTEYTVSTLPLAPTAPICKNGVAYQVAP